MIGPPRRRNLAIRLGGQTRTPSTTSEALNRCKRDATIVEHEHRVACGDPFELFADDPLAHGAGRPGLLVLRCVPDREEQAADVRMPFTCRLLTPFGPLGGDPLCRRAGRRHVGMA